MDKNKYCTKKIKCDLQNPTVGQLADTLDQFSRDMRMMFVSNKQINPGMTYVDDYETFFTSNVEVFHEINSENVVFLNLYSEKVYQKTGETSYFLTQSMLTDIQNTKLDSVIGEVARCVEHLKMDASILEQSAYSSSEALMKYNNVEHRCDLLIQAIKVLLFMNCALKRNNDVMNLLMAMDEGATISYEKIGDLIHVKIYHVLIKKCVMEFDLELFPKEKRAFVSHLTV